MTVLDGYRFRALASNAVQSDVPSASARLTVNVGATPPAATLAATATTYSAAGGTITLTATITYANAPASLGFQVELPAGWSYDGGIDEPAIKPDSGTTGTLEWAYSSGFGSGSSSFTVNLRYPAGLAGDQTVAGTAIYRSPLTTIVVTPLVFTRAATPLETWRAARFTSAELSDVAVSGLEADPDRDGLSNLLEYALGLDPKTANASGLPAVSAEGANWVYSYARPTDRTDLVYTVEVSTNLATWSSTGVTHERIATVNGTETWRAIHPTSGAPALFFRLKIATAQ